MNIAARVDAAVAETFKQKLGGEATLETVAPYREEVAGRMAEACPELAEGLNVRITPDHDNQNLLVVVKHVGLRIRETRTVAFADIDAKSPPPKKLDENPAPETAPTKRSGKR